MPRGWWNFRGTGYEADTRKKYSSCEMVERAETADGWFCGIFEIEKIFERKFFETSGSKG